MTKNVHIRRNVIERNRWSHEQGRKTCAVALREPEGIANSSAAKLLELSGCSCEGAQMSRSFRGVGGCDETGPNGASNSQRNNRACKGRLPILHPRLDNSSRSAESL